jgi:hypothetical protein
MTKLRLLLLATTALTALQFVSAPSHAQTAPLVMAQAKEELGPDGKPKQPPKGAPPPGRPAPPAAAPPHPAPPAAPPPPHPAPPAAAPPPRPTPPPAPPPHPHRRLLRLQRQPPLRRSLRPRQLLRRPHRPCSRSRKARRRHPPCNRRSGNGSEAGKDRARHRSPLRAEPRQRRRHRQRQPLLLQPRLPQAHRRQVRDHRPRQRSRRRLRLRPEHLRSVAHNRTPSLREQLQEQLQVHLARRLPWPANRPAARPSYGMRRQP